MRRIRLTLSFDLKADDTVVRVITQDWLFDPRTSEQEALTTAATSIRQRIKADLALGRLPWGPSVDRQLKQAKAITVTFNEEASARALAAQYALKQHLRTIRQILTALGA